MRVVLERPTAGVDFALQKGKGKPFDLEGKQRSKGGNLEFEFTITAKAGKDLPNFTGPFVQGPSGERFVYINIGTYAGQTNTCWSRRLKIPLGGITWNMIRSGKVLIASIPGTGKDGGPSCAYSWRKEVDPSWNWKMEK